MSVPHLPKIDPTLRSFVAEQDPSPFSMTTSSSGYHSHDLAEQSAAGAEHDVDCGLDNLELEKSCCYGEELRLTQQRIKCLLSCPMTIRLYVQLLCHGSKISILYIGSDWYLVVCQDFNEENCVSHSALKVTEPRQTIIIIKLKGLGRKQIT